jgi:hypothetical protein
MNSRGLPAGNRVVLDKCMPQFEQPQAEHMT